MQVADQRHTGFPDALDFMEMQAEELAPRHPVATLRVVLTTPAAQRHAILRDEHGQVKLGMVVHTEEVQSAWKHAPIPPLTRHRIQYQERSDLFLALMIRPHRQPHDMSCERIVVIKRNVIKQPRAG
jgi:hypothetical protein